MRYFGGHARRRYPLLDAIGAGDQKTAGQLLPLVYEELRRLAAYKTANESPGQTLQPTALVHEAWLRLGRDADRQWPGRTYFFAAAAEARATAETKRP